jgi:hypothetical protein
MREFASAAERFLAVLKAGPEACPRFSRDALVLAAAYVDRLRTEGFTDSRSLCLWSGARLGECLLAAHGGSWTQVLDEWAIQLPEGCVLFPFASAADHLAHGADASILRYYDAVSAVLRADVEWDLSYL